MQKTQKQRQNAKRASEKAEEVRDRQSLEAGCCPETLGFYLMVWGFSLNYLGLSTLSIPGIFQTNPENAPPRSKRR